MQADSGTITLEQLDAGSGSLAVIATAGSIIDLADVGAVDLIGAGLIMRAGAEIGSATNPLETTVSHLSASAPAATEGVFITETDAVVVDTVTVSVSRVNTTGTLEASAVETTQSDLEVAGGGALALTAGGNVQEQTDGPPWGNAFR